MSTYNSRISSIDVRKYNKYAVLDLIRFSPGGLSRADLARQIGLTRSAITTIVNDLLRLGVIREMEENGSTTGGRRPIPLEINPQRGYVAGIDLGATHVAIEITDYSKSIHPLLSQAVRRNVFRWWIQN
jgi:predicted transcriptional regulator